MNLKRTKIIIAREYKNIVSRKSFIVMTLLIPVLLLAMIFLPMLLKNINDSSASMHETIVVLDQSGLGQQLLPSNDQFSFSVMPATPADDPHALYSQAENLSAVVVLPKDIAESKAVNVYSGNTLNAALTNYIKDQLDTQLSAIKMQSYNIPELDKIVDDIKCDVKVNTVKWNEKGEETDSSTGAAMALGMILAFVIYMFVLIDGAMIMNSVIEEKTNRIVEVIVGSCKPFELMIGKIVGVGLAGLTQLVIWILLFVIVGMFLPLNQNESVGGLMAVFQAVSSINLFTVITTFIIYFIGGYLLYASLFAAFGSAVDQASDAGQFTTPIIMIMVIALYIGIACMENPNGDMAMWCSLIPFTSPIVMMVRVPYGVPAWQLIASIVLLYACALLMIKFSARIYRTGILMYGKKHSVKDIFKWIK